MNYLNTIEIAKRKNPLEKIEIINSILNKEDSFHWFEYVGLQKLLDASIKKFAEIFEGEENIPERIQMKIKDLSCKFNEYKEIDGNYERPYIKNRGLAK